MKETVKEKKWIEIILALVWMGLIKIIQAMSLFHFWGGAVSYKNLYKTRERNKYSPIYRGKKKVPLSLFFFRLLSLSFYSFPFCKFMSLSVYQFICLNFY
jgi:hypothetical protein